MARLSLAVAASLLASPACAGKLDLDLYSHVRPNFARSESPIATGALWLPGDPRNTKGASFTVQAISDAGNAGLGIAGMAQTVGAAGKSREAAAMSAGFGAIAIINLWRSWKLWRDPAAEDRKK